MVTDAAELQELKDQIFWQERDLRKMREEISNQQEDITKLKGTIELLELRIRRIQEEYY